MFCLAFPLSALEGPDEDAPLGNLANSHEEAYYAACPERTHQEVKIASVQLAGCGSEPLDMGCKVIADTWSPAAMNRFKHNHCPEMVVKQPLWIFIDFCIEDNTADLFQV